MDTFNCQIALHIVFCGFKISMKIENSKIINYIHPKIKVICRSPFKVI